MRTIKVIGNASISVRPDLTNITMNLSGKSAKYEECVNKSAFDLNVISMCLMEFGFIRSELKTTSFNVSPNVESYYDNENKYKTKTNGFIYHMDLKLSFKSDNDKLSKILESIMKLNVKPTINIFYSVSDSKACERELITKAVEEAKEKALIIAECCDVKLKRIVEINYIKNNMDFTSDSYELMPQSLKCANEQFKIDIEPEEIVKEDSVTLIYEIE